jgi:hypothetical protein
MKAISVKQPWAGLIVDGFKKVENRKYPTHFRGRICIQAGLKPWDGPEATGARWTPYQAYFGCVVGTVAIINCVQNSRSRWALPGWWHWVLADPRALRSPFEFTGKQGWFEVPDRWLPARHLR